MSGCDTEQQQGLLNSLDKSSRSGCWCWEIPKSESPGFVPSWAGGCRVGTQMCIHRQIEYEKQLMKALWSLTAVLVFTHRICVRMLWPHPPELKEWDLRRFKYVQIHHSFPAKGIINSFISSVCNALKSQTESFTRKKKLGQLRNEGWCVLVSAALCSSS